MANLDLIQFDYDRNKDYTITALNTIGASTSLTLRTVPTPGGDIAYVRKFGTDYLITEVTDIEDPVDANMTFNVYALDGTLLGSRTGGGAFSAGSTLSTAQGCYLEIAASGGNVTVLAGIDIDTDVDAGGLTFVCAAETVTDGNTLRLYMSDTGSTYYDENYMYGGARHTPALNDTRTPYFTIAAAYAAIASANDDAVEVLDSAIYDEELTFDSSQTSIYASLGQTPTITAGIGARNTRNVNNLYNNTNTSYFNENGDNGNPGTWQKPFQTLNYAWPNRGVSYNVVYGGNGAIENGIIVLTADLTITGNVAYLEADYGYTPTIVDYVLKTDYNFYIAGFKFNGIYDRSLSFCFNFNYTANEEAQSEITDCTLWNGIFGIRVESNHANCVINRCIIYNTTEGIRAGQTYAWVNGRMTVTNCRIYNNYYGIRIYLANSRWGEIDTSYLKINNNNIYNNNLYNYLCEFNLAGETHVFDYVEFTNNFFYGSAVGYCTLQTAGTMNITGSAPAELIFHTNTTAVNLHAADTFTYCNFYNNTTKSVGAALTSNNEISGDPAICRLTSYLGLSSDSVTLKADGSERDTGILLKNILIEANNITINGFIIDGKNLYNNAVCMDGGTDYTDLIIKWCTIKNYQGIALDIYSGTDTDSMIQNSIFYNNGNSIKLTQGGNIVQDCIIYRSIIHGIYSEQTENIFEHISFHNNQYGLYLYSTSSNIVYKNNISHSNYLYGIYSDINLIVINSCITDTLNSNVNISDSTNITDDPLFVNTNTDTEDFHLKREERGYIINSPCILTADDDRDMGAWDETSALTSDDWKKYRVKYNPKNAREFLMQKGRVRFQDITGNEFIYADSYKLRFNLNWDTADATTEEQRKKIFYLSKLIPTRKNQKSINACDIRLYLLPDSYYGTGSAVIDASAKTLTDANAAYYEDEKEGWWASIEFDSGSDYAVDFRANHYASAKVDYTSEAISGTGSITYNASGLNDTTGKALITLPGGETNKTYYLSKTLSLSYDYVIYSFYINVDDLTMGAGELFGFNVLRSTGPYLIYFHIQESGGNIQIRLNADSDAAAVSSTSFYTLSSGDNFINILGKRALTSVSADGSYILYINNIKKETLSGIDNYDIYDGFTNSLSAYYGLTLSLDAGTSGTIGMDEHFICTGTGIFIDENQKNGYCSAAAWTDDEWIGYYIYIEGKDKIKYYFLITDNDSNILTISDSNNYLKTGFYEYKIVKNFKIESNTNTVLTVIDDNSELVSGNYNYFINFIKCRSFGYNDYNQDNYNYLDESQKTGYNIELEEVD